MREHKHVEAFNLMKYLSDDGTEEEIIWNSRDGVTPFVVSLRSGKSATHVDWVRDVYSPDFDPPVGSRVFVDLTLEAARRYAEKRTEQYWRTNAFGCRQMYKTKDQMVDALVTETLDRPGAPDLIEVTEEWKMSR